MDFNKHKKVTYRVTGVPLLPGALHIVHVVMYVITLNTYTDA